MPTTLIITNDFPPRLGGIESFVSDLVDLLDGDVVVYTSSTPGSQVWDDQRGVHVVRGGRVLLPTSTTTRRAVQILHDSGATRVLFGAAAPLGLMARSLRRAGAERLVALSHGHEIWWATLPASRTLLRRLADDVDHLTTISDYAASRIAPALSPSARDRMLRLAPPVDTAVFRPDPERARSAGRRVVSVGRLVRQKGFDALLEAWRLVLDGWPHPVPPELRVIGDGPRRPHLEARITDLHLRSSVTLLGARPRIEVVSELQGADAFALLMRTRLAGLNPEGLGLAALEASACGLPVVVGDSGGSRETVLAGRTGYVVDPADPHQVAARLLELLTTPSLAGRLGREGRRFVASQFGREPARLTLRAALGLSS
jgi:phosphatidylinositol alpha-1,6-mannosyltransferase